MFKRYAVQTQTKVVRENGAAPETDENPMVGVEIAAAYADIAKDLITHAALTIGGVWAACKIVERICK
jgi:hypothetical protein